ncbi:MAG: excalibur calcium-binding domain-containing protein [Rhizobiales bacterium]|nr:excalibur calcium-binding domain-containing protein [Hyphomicrobiales bacterium]
MQYLTADNAKTYLDDYMAKRFRWWLDDPDRRRKREERRRQEWLDQKRHREAERRAKRLKSKFRSVSRRLEVQDSIRRARQRAPKLFLILLGLFALGGGVTYALMNSEWPFWTNVKHYAAFAGCDAARALNLAPAHRGDPGYWRKLDADNDGIACEPYFKRLHDGGSRRNREIEVR